MRILHIITVVFIFLLMSSFVAQAQNAQRDRDDEIIERLIRLETQMTAMNVRIDDLRNEMKGDIADLRGLVYVTLGGIMTLMCGLLAMMGFVMWDRRTAISPVVKKTKELEQRFEEIAPLANENVALWKVLKGYASVEPRFAEILKTAGML